MNIDYFNKIVTIIFILCYTYQALYLFLPLFVRNRTRVINDKTNRYAILIAARNEEQVIGNLIDSLKNQNYPSDYVDIYVCADNCSDNTYELISEGERGDDIVLSIDIDIQKYLEEVLSEEVLNTKYEPNTTYYDHSFAVVSSPVDGSILAMAGKRVVKGDDGAYKVVDYTPGIVTTSVTPGSIVKGASMLVGYKYGAIDIGSYETDECIKIKATPLKCSWRTLGYINDINALAYSSNVYQYKIAIKVGGGNYVYDGPLSINEDAFTKYRDMYSSFGLGVKTGIDLPNEKHVSIALTSIYGIGRKLALTICNDAKVDPSKKAKDLDQDELNMNIKTKMEINSYQGTRHKKGLPVRGQRTNRNARTRKGKPKTIANKKK